MGGGVMWKYWVHVFLRSVYHLPFFEASAQLMKRWSTKLSPLSLTPFQPIGWWWWLRLFIVMGYMVITPEQSSHMVKMKCIGKYFTWVSICFGWKEKIGRVITTDPNNATISIYCWLSNFPPTSELFIHIVPQAWYVNVWALIDYHIPLWSFSTTLLVKYACTQGKGKYFKSAETIPCSDLFVLTYQGIYFVKKKYHQRWR